MQCKDTSTRDGYYLFTIGRGDFYPCIFFFWNYYMHRIFSGRAHIDPTDNRGMGKTQAKVTSRGGTAHIKCAPDPYTQGCQRSI